MGGQARTRALSQAKSPPKEEHARCCCKQVGDEAKVKQEI